jgi:hypothetical protein
MTHHTNSALHRALASIRRTWADMERIQRAMLELEPDPRRRLR